jgi:hypothetical protein
MRGVAGKKRKNAPLSRFCVFRIEGTFGSYYGEVLHIRLWP